MSKRTKDKEKVTDEIIKEEYSREEVTASSKMLKWGHAWQGIKEEAIVVTAMSKGKNSKRCGLQGAGDQITL